MKRTILVTLLLIVIALTLFLGVRQLRAERAIEQDWDTPKELIPTLKPTTRLEILPLYEEASASPDLLSGHGVSYLIHTDASTILLDVGNNPDDLSIAPFMQNMKKLGLAWDEIDRIVISHIHPDHIGGLNVWLKRTISFGELPSGLDERPVFVPSVVKNKGAIHATVPTLPSPDVATSGVILYPEVWPLSLRDPKGYEQALVVHVAGQGLVLISGCGHPTLERLVIRAEFLYDLPVIGVVGGLHYESHTAADVAAPIEFLTSRNSQLVAISPHDSSLEAIEAFRAAFPQAYQDVVVGHLIQFP